MSTTKFRLNCPDVVAESLIGGPVLEALQTVAALAGGELTIESPAKNAGQAGQVAGRPDCLSVNYRGKTMGRLLCTASAQDSAPRRAGHAITSFVSHMVDREFAVNDLADALMTSYEEMNLVYTLLPTMATGVHPQQIADILVAETSRTLACRRVSLLSLDEKRQNYTVLAARGLPAEALGLSIPVSDSVAARALWEEDLLVINDISDRPDLKGLSRGQYVSNSFAVVRVPLEARGEALGFLTATERIGGKEFTARDRKLLESLSAMGASALLNCRLHAAVNRQMMSTIHALASAVDAKDRYTHDHAGRVAQLCVATARQLGVTDEVRCRGVELAALLHDIGKIGIPDAILSKPTTLSRAEFIEIQKHVEIGARIVEHVPGLEEVSKSIYHHHERHDGLGYPTGLSDGSIPLAARLITVADTFDALTSDRPYRSAGPTKEALLELRRNAGTQFDPAVVDAFIEVIEQDSRLGKPQRPAMVAL